jgi:hypothetical protein
MKWPGCPSSLVLLLAAVLLAGPVGGTQTASAQAPALNGNLPLSSLPAAIRTAQAESTLVSLATTLLRAREETTISHAAYRDGVRAFRELRPTFYGNFFGDPFFASYDVRYQRLTRERQAVEVNLNPAKRFRDGTALACAPMSYDPAFGGVCRGVRFAASDFFFLPSFLAFRASAPPSFPSLLPDMPTTAGTQQTPTARAENTREPGRAPTPLGPTAPAETRPSDRGRVPDVAARMQAAASRMRRVEVRTRLQRLIDEEYGGRENLTPRQQSRLATEAARLLSSPNERELRPAQLRNRLGPRASRRVPRERSPEARPPRTARPTANRSSSSGANDQSSPSRQATPVRTPAAADEQ